MLCTICDYKDPVAKFGAQCPVDQSYLVDEVSHREGQGDPLLGRLIGDEFAIVGIIGTGGFGSVYRCIQQPIGRTVAVKILHGHAYRRLEVRRRFVREAKALARLSDPNIVQFIRFSEVKSESGRSGQDFFFIAQEYVDGVHLGQIIRSSAPMAWTRVKFLTRSILKALAAAHKQSITHRDLKPTNIMVCEDAFQGDLVKVLDFGIAKFLAEQDDEEEQTMTGTLLGTPNYMSPEQIRNQTVGPASDLYAVGILMYEMLTGKRPFHRDSKIDTLRAHLEGALPDLSKLPLAAQKIIAVALCKAPQDRFKSAREMAEALDRLDSLGSFTSDGVQSVYEPLDVNTIVDLSQEEATSVDSTSVVVDRMQRSLEEPLDLPEDSRSVGGVFLLAIIGSVLGVLGWWMQTQSTSTKVAKPQKEVQKTVKPSTNPRPIAPPETVKPTPIPVKQSSNRNESDPNKKSSPRDKAVQNTPKAAPKSASSKLKPRQARRRTKESRPKDIKARRRVRAAKPMKKSPTSPVRTIPAKPSQKEVEIQEL